MESNVDVNAETQIIDLNAIVQIKKVSIIIVVWNNAHLTVGCLASLWRYTDFPFDLIIIDNNSDPKERNIVEDYVVSCENLRNRTRIEYMDKNLGFIEGTKVGLQFATGDAVVLLNNDTVVTQSWLRKMVTVLNQDKDIGIVGPICSTSEHRGWQSVENLREKWIHEGIPEEKGSIHAYGAELQAAKTGQYKEMGGMLAFFCVVMRATMIERLGWLDGETFGVGFADDDDYCERAKNDGWKLALALDTYIHHYHRSTFKIRDDLDWKKLQEENLAKFKAKYGG